jgi:hypothetical protein
MVLAAAAGAQEAELWISGKVRNRTTWQPLAGAEVRVLGSDLKAVSNNEGYFVIDGVAAGSHTIEVGCTGYLSHKLEVSVSDGIDSEVTIALVPLVFLSEVVVTPSHFKLLGDQPEPRLFLDRESVDRLPHLANDLYRAISWLPGTSGDDISAKIHIRGGEENEILMMLDGLEIYEPFHLKDFDSIFSVVDGRAVGGLDMLTGGFPAEYGNRMSGVIDITSRTTTENLQTELDVSFINAGVLSEGSFAEDRGQWLVSVRRGYLDIVLGWVDDDSDFKPIYYDALAKLQYRISGRSTLSANLLASWDDLTYEEYDDAGDILEEEVEKR